MSVTTNAGLFERLKESDILSPEQLKRAENLFGEEDDPRRAARTLMKSDLLTRWQASQLLKGSSLLSLGKYVLLERLPWGSNHAVFLATHPMMERKVALNVLDKASSGRSDSRDSFLSDARAIASLDHRHLIHVYDIDEAQGRCFLVMEYVKGSNLHDKVKTDGPLSIEVAADTIRQIAEGLAHAHANKLIHGGLRPTNVIVDDHRTAKVIDLGLSKFDDLSKKPAGDEDDSKIMSIADYLSPEQAAGQLPTPAADIYSLGCIAFFMLAGVAPYGKGSYTQRLQRHQHDKVPDVRKARKDAPAGLAKIVAKMMAKDAGERYAAAKEIVKDLEAWWAEYAAKNAANKSKPQAAKPAPDRPSGVTKPTAASAAPVAAAPPPKKGAQPAPSKPAPSKPLASKPASTKTAPKKASDTPVDSGGFPTISIGGAKSKAAPVVNTAAVAPKPTPKVDAPQPQDAATEKKPLPLALILGGAGVLLLLLLVGAAAGAYFFIFKPAAESVQVAIEDNIGEAGVTDPANDPPVAPGDEGNQVPDEPGENRPDGEGEVPDENPDGEVVPVDPEPPVDGPAVDPEPPKDPVEPEPEPEPEPKPPKNDPKPAKPKNPFTAMATAAELPPAAGEVKSISLGKLDLPEEFACYIDLLGGENVTPKEGNTFTLDRARNGLADREWEFKLESEGKGSIVVATMALADGDLKFDWTAEAASREEAPYLCNCALNLRTSDFETYLALRKPQQVEALVVNLERPTSREKFSIPNAPNLETLYVEITKVDGAENVDFQPKQELAVTKDSTIAWWGGGERLLGFKIDTLMTKDLQLSMTAVVDASGQTIPFNGPKFAQAYGQASAVSLQLGPQVEAMKKNRDKYRKQLPTLMQQLSLATQTVETLDKLKAQAEKANGAAVHFRVFRNAGDHKIDILHGSIVPEAAAKPARE